MCTISISHVFLRGKKKLQQTSTRTVGDGLIADHHRSQKGRNPRHLSEVPLCLARKPPGKTNEITIVISYIFIYLYIYSMYTVYCNFITCCTYSVHILPYWKTTHLNVHLLDSPGWKLRWYAFLVSFTEFYFSGSRVSKKQCQNMGIQHRSFSISNVDLSRLRLFWQGIQRHSLACKLRLQASFNYFCSANGNNH